MKTELEDPCTCGHTASFHENEQTEYDLRFKQEVVTIIKVKVFTKCSWYKNVAENYKIDYNECPCLLFKLDNLRYLEEKSK
jgi:hypothetical protein